ncbi:MAG: exosortase/archaeosortase family protein [Proteobacteria bacterium]|nr:exosortase/archaeosortase family protein [Pseudomonadota bacterium]
MKNIFISLKAYLNKRNSIFFISTLVILRICFEALIILFRIDTYAEYYSHIILVPLASGYLIYKKRKIIFSNLEHSYAVGIPLLAVGIILFLLGRNMRENLGMNDYVALVIISALILWIGSFIVLYGINAFRAAFFPFLFLLFIIPFPSLLLDKIIYTLNVISAWITYILFKLAGISFLKEGFVFHCPGIDISIDQQCSGIRSAMGILMPAIFSSYLFLYTGWKRALFIFSVFPIIILKNGFRIFVLSMMAIYLNPQHPVLEFLHLRGGALFAIPAICLLGCIFIFLIKSEKKKRN